LFFDRTESFINGRKHLVSFFNLLGLKPVPQFGTLFGCQLFDCFLDFDQIAPYQSNELTNQTLTVLGMSQDLSGLDYKYLGMNNLRKCIDVIPCFTFPILGERNAGSEMSEFRNIGREEVAAEIQTPTRRFAEPSSDPWSLETNPSSLLILGSAILTDPLGEIRIVFLVAS
jgi:hypothetical protein